MVLTYFRRLKVRKYAAEADFVCNGILTLAGESFPWAYSADFADKQRHQARFEAISFVAISFMTAFKDQTGLCQAVHDKLFDRFDMALREQGVGDIAMSHRMKKYAAAFAGRLSRYTELLTAGDVEALGEAVTKNAGYEAERSKEVSEMMHAWVKEWSGMTSARDWADGYLKQEKMAS